MHDSSGHHNDDPVNIAWTSSENEGSGNEGSKQVLAKAVPPKRQERKRRVQRPAARAPHALPADEGTDSETARHVRKLVVGGSVAEEVERVCW